HRPNPAAPRWPVGWHRPGRRRDRRTPAGSPRFPNRNKNATVIDSEIGGKRVKAYEASSTIAAKPDAIWAILTDGANYPSWDSGVERVEGRIAPGETVKVYVKVNPGRAFPIKVTELQPGQRLASTVAAPLPMAEPDMDHGNPPPALSRSILESPHRHLLCLAKCNDCRDHTSRSRQSPFIEVSSLR